MVKFTHEEWNLLKVLISLIAIIIGLLLGQKMQDLFRGFKRWRKLPRKSQYKLVDDVIYFFNKSDAEALRKNDQKIYYSTGLGYYIVNPKESGFSDRVTKDEII